MPNHCFQLNIALSQKSVVEIFFSKSPKNVPLEIMGLVIVILQHTTLLQRLQRVIVLPQFPPLLISHITIVYLSQIRNHHHYLLNSTFNSDVVSYSTNIFKSRIPHCIQLLHLLDLFWSVIISQFFLDLQSLGKYCSGVWWNALKFVCVVYCS